MSSFRRGAVVAFALVLVAPLARADGGACSDAYAKAQELRTKRKLTGAREALRVCSQSTCAAFIVKDCTTWLDEVQASMPSVVPVATDAAGNDVAAKISMDGETLTESSDGRSFDVDPGKHTFTFELTGAQGEQGAAVVKHVIVAEGEKNKRVSVVLQKPGAPGATAAPPPPVAPVVQPIPVQPLRPQARPVSVSVESDPDGMRIQMDSYETNTHKSCTAPCAAEVPPGTYMVGMASGDGPVMHSQSLYFSGAGTVKASSVKYTGLHVAGAVALVGGLLFQIGATAGAFLHKTCADTVSFDGETEGEDCTYHTDGSLLSAGFAVGIAGFTAGIILLAQKNHTDVHFVPLSVSSIGVPREAAWLSAASNPQGEALEVRF
ncbi:MAG: hypothetical protein ACLQVI_33280 [Polyangiaceae bacterium]